MLQKAYQAYDTMSKETMSGRELEAHVLTKAANKLKTCLSDVYTPEKRRQLSEVLNYNQKIWNVLQEELMNENNPLPTELRQNLLNISLFVDNHTIKTQAYPESGKVKILMDINLNLAAGLRENPSK